MVTQTIWGKKMVSYFLNIAFAISIATFSLSVLHYNVYQDHEEETPTAFNLHSCDVPEIKVLQEPVTENEDSLVSPSPTKPTESETPLLNPINTVTTALDIAAPTPKTAFEMQPAIWFACYLFFPFFTWMVGWMCLHSGWGQPSGAEEFGLNQFIVMGGLIWAIVTACSFILCGTGFLLLYGLMKEH
nr:PREDICTED: uncharacterized protein LOC106702969 [Latimeria chalumnae]|eukprot:XP_014342234.1 PREDICTED: uncharacterized protein LOC106702969 [Latimeria chalumnae]